MITGEFGDTTPAPKAITLHDKLAKMMALRQKYIDKGGQLFSINEINRESWPDDAKEVVSELTEQLAACQRECEKLSRIIELKNVAIDRWVPCPDHRDKNERGRCYVCALEAAERECEGLRALLRKAGARIKHAPLCRGYPNGLDGDCHCGYLLLRESIDSALSNDAEAGR